MSIETPDRAVFSELERELVRAATHRNAAPAAPPRRAGVLVPAMAAAVAIAVVVVALSSLGSGPNRHTTVPPVESGPPTAALPATPRERANEQAARVAADRLFELINLPAATLPVADDISTTGQLGAATKTVMNTNHVDVHSFWRVPGKPAAAIAWVESHPPRGAATSGAGGGGTGGVTLHWNVTFFYPPIPGTVLWRALNFTAAAARGGGTAMRVDAEAMWEIPRPRASIVPSTANRLEWRSGAAAGIEHVFTSPARVGDVVRWLNAAPVERPPVGNPCFSSATPNGPRFLLFTDGRRQPVAVAEWNCGAVALVIGGRRYYLSLAAEPQAGSAVEAALMGGTFR